MSFDNVVMSNVYMKDLNEFGAMNKVYAEYFKGCLLYTSRCV